MTKLLQRQHLKPLSLTILLFGLSITIPSTRPAYACSCLQPPAPNQALADARAVFSGKVTNIQQDRYTLNVTFEVDQQWKGDEAETIVIQTATSSATCGYPFEVNQTYLVYANQPQGSKLRTDHCSRTTLLNQATDDLSELGKDLPCNRRTSRD